MISLFFVVLCFVLVLLTKWYRTHYIIIPKKLEHIFKGKSAVVTGASSGIGKALAFYLAQKGIKYLILAARRRDVLEQIATQIRKQFHGVQVFCMEVDISEEKQCKECVTEIFKTHLTDYKKLDYFFLNAGISQLLHFDELQTLEPIHKIMNTNYWGVVNLLFYALPWMRKQTSASHIIVVSSLLGKQGSRMRTGYSSSKFALHGFLESLRAELIYQKVPIHIHIPCPGFVITEIHHHAVGSEQTQPERNLSRMMTAERCAEEICESVANDEFEHIFTVPARIGLLLKPLLPLAVMDFVREKIASTVKRE